MIWIDGGTFLMGSDSHYPEEAPAHRVIVAPFWIDRTPVTNRAFRRFVKATGYVTVAEIAPDPKDYPGALPRMLKPGSLVFTPPRHAVDLRDWSQWWKFEFGANWRQPYERRRPNRALDDHPVVHVAFKDAEAYAKWEDKELPTEAEWEYAARGGLDGAEFAWGEELTPGGRHMANTWQGAFPKQNLGTDGYKGTSPVGVFPVNGYGLCDMIGNVWEWTADWFSPRHAAPMQHACCIPHNPRGAREADSYDGCDTSIRIPRKVVKGGSHLCAPNYCRRYRHESCRLSLRGPLPARVRRPTGGAMSDTRPQGLTGFARVIVALVIVLIVAGAALNGVSAGVWYRFFHNLIDRPDGPMRFRVILQPVMAMIAAIRDGRMDAVTGNGPFVWTILSKPRERMARLHEALNATARIILLAVIMDVIYQLLVLKTFYPGEAAVVALTLAFLPYVMIRGLVLRVARARASAAGSDASAGVIHRTKGAGHD